MSEYVIYSTKRNKFFSPEYFDQPQDEQWVDDVEEARLYPLYGANILTSQNDGDLHVWKYRGRNEFFGSGVYQCPYCNTWHDGYESNDDFCCNECRNENNTSSFADENRFGKHEYGIN